MLLADVDIAERIHSGDLRIDPWSPELLQPSSVDVRLDASFRVHSDRYRMVDPLNIPADLFEEIPGFDPLWLYPGHFVLGSTLERVGIPEDLAAAVEGKSTLGRLGLQVHATAGYIDPGFEGQVTLEMSNVGPIPILLTPGMLVAQLVFFEMASPAAKPYGHIDLGSHYQYQRGATPPSGSTSST